MAKFDAAVFSNLECRSLCFRIVNVILHPFEHKPLQNKLFFFSICITNINVFKLNCVGMNLRPITTRARFEVMYKSFLGIILLYVIHISINPLTQT